MIENDYVDQLSPYEQRRETLKLVMEELQTSARPKSLLTIAGEMELLKGGASPVSYDMLRQYSCGRKQASEAKIRSIALMARALGYAGQHCDAVINATPAKDQKWCGKTAENHKVLRARFDKVGKALKRSEKQSLIRLENAIRNVAAFGYDDLELTFATQMLIRKIVPAEQYKDSGLVEPMWLPAGCDTYSETVVVGAVIKPLGLICDSPDSPDGGEQQATLPEKPALWHGLKVD